MRSWSFYYDYPMLIHHVVGIIPFSLGAYYKQFISWGPPIVLTEISTPFVNLRWFLFITGQTSSPLYAVNGLGMWLAFLLCRIIWIPLALKDLFLNLDTYMFKYWLPITLPVVVGVFIAYGLSSYWFYLITKGLVKTIVKMVSSDSPSESSTSSNTNKKAKKMD